MGKEIGYKITDGENEDFKELCRLLDLELNEIAGGGESRLADLPYE